MGSPVSDFGAGERAALGRQRADHAGNGPQDHPLTPRWIPVW
ncbi:hypothetical protein [Mycobacterium botniense]|nr:hypothetical protein [Mycobacterium botniense]